MANIRILRQSFSGGEISPQLYGRFDLEKFTQAVEVSENFITLPHGPAINRAGFRFVHEVKNSNSFTRLIPFNFSSTQTFAIELGAGYFRFHTQGGTLLTPTLLPYEVENPYLEADLPLIKYSSDGDVITFVHKNYPPSELTRISNLNWTFTPVEFVSKTLAPASCSVVATSPTPGVPKKFRYAATALNSLGYEESPKSPDSNIVNNDLTITGNFNTISWDPVDGAIRYNVYKYAGGTFAFIGQTAGTSFVDDNIIADLSRTIPINDVNLTTPGNYPSAVGYHDQRRFFANTEREPTNVWATQSSSPYNMAYSIPSQDSDSIRFRIIGRSNGIRHISALQDLVFLTASTEWRINTSSDAALSASNLTVRSQSQNGASEVQPVQINNYLLYEQAQGGHVREMTFQWQTQAYDSNDISLLAPHLFDNLKIKDMAFSHAPYPINWVVSSNGNLLGLTYVPEQKISAWHRHTTKDGLFESCCTVTEGNEDPLYVIVKRTFLNGTVKRYVEISSSRFFTDQANCFFVDSGLSYSKMIPATVFTGLDHLEGETVSILADAVVQIPQKVVNGTITLQQPALKVHAGLPITADLKTLPTYFQDQVFGQSRVKNINKTWLRVFDSREFSAGPNQDKMTLIRTNDLPELGQPKPLFTGEIELVLEPDYNQEGQILIRQSEPLPLTVVYIATEVVIGG